MKIFFCTNTFESLGNGPSKFAQLLTELNDRSDIELHIISEDIEDPDDLLYHKVKIKNTFLSRHIGMITRNHDYFLTIQRMLLSQSPPDIIVFNNAITGIKSYKNFSIPCIGMINDYSSIEIGSPSSIGFKNYIRRKVFNYYENLSCRHADVIIANSKILKEKILQAYSPKNDKVKILYKSIDIKTNSFSNAFSQENNINLLFVKTDWKNGGLDILIEALGLLEYSFVLNIVGPKEKDFESIKNINQFENLTLNLLGRLTQEEIFKLLLTVDVFCTPSRQEALGVANMEALIHKTPVVYSNTGGIPEVMDYGNNGFESETANPTSLAHAIKECIQNKNLRKKKSENGFHFVKTKFNKDEMLNNFIKICNETVTSSN